MTDEALFIDSEEFSKAMQECSLPVAGMVMDIIMVLWFPAKQPIPIDPPAIVERLNAVFTKREYTVELFESHRPELEQFFVTVSGNRWVPSPKFFSVTDANLESFGEGEGGS